jgi:predicted secreted hydrolase
MDRRLLLKIFGASTAAAQVFPAQAGETSPRSYAWPFPEYPPTEPGSGNATPFGQGAMAGVETQSGHALYTFPRDHRYHYGPIYHGPEYCEWYYFSAFVYDKKTGDPYTLFWMSLLAGWDEGLQRPVKNTFFAAHNLRTGSFRPSVTLYPGELRTEGSAADAPRESFWFRYACGTPEHGQVEESYRAADETWQFKASVNKAAPERRAVTFDMDITGRVYAPGYVFNTPWGLENEGYDTSRKGLHNPETVYGLSYYTIAPKMMISGPVTVDGQEMEVEGVAWWEHQWGNLRTPDHEEGIYIWQNAYLDNGDMFRLRFWRKPDLTIADAITNYAYIHADGRMEYAFGPAVRWTTIKSWPSNVVEGVDIPLYGKLETPQGVYYVAPEFPEQQAIGFAPNTALWEGCVYLHEGSLDGPIVGRAYHENMITPWYYIPRGFDRPMREDIRRKLDGGLPPAPPFAFYK